MRLLAAFPPDFDPARPWEEEGVLARHDLHLFRHEVLRRRSPHTGRTHAFTRLHSPDWVNVIAFLAGDSEPELLVVEQFRHGLDQSTLEIPGGVCDAGETPLESARRELLEESGFEAERWIPLGACAPNPATQSNHCHFFLALDCRAAAALDLDPAEELRLWAVPWSEWKQKLRDGAVDHALVLAAVCKLAQWEGWPALRERLEKP